MVPRLPRGNRVSASCIVVLLCIIAFADGVRIRDARNALPIWKGALLPGNSELAWSAPCFQNNSARLFATPTSGKIFINASNYVSDFCTDVYVIANRETFYIREFVFSGEHTITIDQWLPYEYDDIMERGFQIFSVTNDFIGTIADAYQFYEAVMDTQVSVYYLKAESNFTFIPRNKEHIIVRVNATDIDSGDLFVVFQFGGIEILTPFGTGGMATHVAMAMWFPDGELYVIESCSEAGIRRTPYEKWMEAYYQDSLNSHVSLLKLSAQNRKIFDTKKAIEYFETVEGLPYGWYNFMWGWIDTADDNFPPPMTKELVEDMLPYVEKLLPSVAPMWEEAFNLRLNTTNLTTMELYDLMTQRNITFGELISIPESDSWKYPSIPGVGRSMVCSALATSVYKAGGLFADVDDLITTSEFTPKDVYQLRFWDGNWKRPAACLVDDDFPYCQLSGEYKMILDGFNTIKPYPNMNMKCGAMPPKYVRTPAEC